MRCNDDGKTIITSKFADDGSFDTESKPCPGGFTAFKLKVEEEQGKAYVDDDTAANAIELRCADDEKWHKSKEGGWGGWSGVKECPKGYRLAGIKTRVEKNQGGGAGDDTALNGVTMVCKWFDKND
ncbi:vitelline membrane outer layer protein 1-like [Clytia hemisphaerica]|uniref:vitelline membrane outer layer protein 1-like n=1 Tax=Clytia hemisphaerica TaxID=252671 RepID=UPI0034D3B0EB